MIARARRAAALATTMAADRAGRLASVLTGPGTEGVLEFTVALAARPRDQRLAALADAFAVAAAPPALGPAAPLLRRLARELSAALAPPTPSGSRPHVHVAAGPVDGSAPSATDRAACRWHGA
jgi:hypothetical protein